MALPHADPGQVVGLQPLGSKLKDSRTTAIIKSEHFQAVRLVVHAGAKIPSHEVAGNITLHCIEGHVVLGLAPTPIELRAGDWVYLEGGEAHSVEGIEDSSLLLTIIFNKG